jgi:hypothetical protein
MQPLYSTFTALAVSSIYIAWQRYVTFRLHRERTIKERVTYMLWTMACQLQ